MSDEKPDNVVRLVASNVDDKPKINQSIISVLEETLEQARRGEIDLLLVVGRESSGGAIIRASRPCDEIHAMGLLNAASVRMFTLMRPR